MSVFSRADIQLIASILGKAEQKLFDGLGNTSSNPGAILDLETAFIRLRGSTEYHDLDYALNSLHFNVNDPVGLGIREAFFSPKFAMPAGFETSKDNIPSNSNWFPGYDGPPCTEGWGILQYNAWYNWRPSPLAALGEPSGPLPGTSTPNVSGYLRINPDYTYPLHYDFNSNAYSRVLLFRKARFVSLQNNTGVGIDSSANSFSFSIPIDQLQGCRIVQTNGTPYDLRIYSAPELLQSYDTVNQVWSSIGGIALNTPLTALAYNIELSNDGTKYNFEVNMPTTITWGDGVLWHVVIYWDSIDQYLDSDTSPSFTVHAHTLGLSDGILIYLWPTQSFFFPTISDVVGWDQRGSVAANLTVVNQTHYIFYDGQYSAPVDPRTYALPTSWPGAINGIDNHLSGYADLNPGSAAAVRVVVQTQATQSYTIPQLLFGPEIFPDFFPPSWEECEYFPSEPEGTLTIALMVVKRPPAYAYNLKLGNSSIFNPFSEDSSLYSNLSVVWSKQIVPTYALPFIGDPTLTQFCLLPLFQTLNEFRAVSFSGALSQLAFTLLVQAVGEPLSVAPSLGSLTDPTGTPSKIFHNLLKSPVTPILATHPSTEPLAIPFDIPGNLAIYNLANSDPSTELMRLEADALLLTGNKLISANNLELYMDYQAYEDFSSTNSGGNSLGWDYMLRLELVDDSQNTLIKDWPIMASSFYLSDEQMALRTANGQTTVGYFTPETINNINSYRLQGYAGLVPDLTAGQSRLLSTQMVSPPDSTQTTEAQFIASKQAAKETQKQINEDILEYQEDGNTFYNVDTSHYPNLFTSLDSVGVTVTQYTYNAPYWDVNIDYYFGLSDSPEISQFYPTHSTSLPTGADIYLNTDAEGLLITMSDTSELYEASIELKVAVDPTNHTGALTNSGTAYISASLHADNAGTPSSAPLVTSSTEILFNSLTSTYQEIKFLLPYTLESTTNYWLVIAPSELPTGGTLDMNASLTTLGGLQRKTSGSWATDIGSGWMKLYATTSPRADSFTVTQSGLNPGTVETYGNQSQSVLPTNQYTGNTAIDFALKYQSESIAIVPQNDWSVYEASFQIKIENSSGSTPTGTLNFSIYTSKTDSVTGLSVPDELLSIGGTIDFSILESVYNEYKISLPVQLFANTLYFIRIDQYPTPQAQPKVIVYLNSSAPSMNNENGFMFYDNTNLIWRPDTTVVPSWTPGSTLNSAETGAPWMQFYSVNPFVLGVFNRQSNNITQYLPPPNTVRSAPIYSVESTWSYTSKTLPKSGPISIYPRAINVNGSWEYVRFSQDIYYIVRAIIAGEIVDYYGKCTAASSDADPAPSEIPLFVVDIIDDVPIQSNVDSIVYLGIGKTYNDIHNATHGAPPSDLLILRSI